jgi:hypothetical protein
MSSSEPVLVVGPGGGFVVKGAGLEASVQDAHEPVGELTQGGVVLGAAGAFGLPPGPSAWSVLPTIAYPPGVSRQ